MERERHKYLREKERDDEEKKSEMKIMYSLSPHTHTQM